MCARPCWPRGRAGYLSRLWAGLGQPDSRGGPMTATGTTAGAQLTLRPYQRDALTAIEAAALRGVQRQVVSLPTGAGKTVIFAHLLVERQTRTLILVHRDELIHQTLDKLAMVARSEERRVGKECSYRGGQC